MLLKPVVKRFSRLLTTVFLGVRFSQPLVSCVPEMPQEGVSGILVFMENDGGTKRGLNHLNYNMYNKRRGQDLHWNVRDTVLFFLLRKFREHLPSFSSKMFPKLHLYLSKNRLSILSIIQTASNFHDPVIKDYIVDRVVFHINSIIWIITASGGRIRLE